MRPDPSYSGDGDAKHVNGWVKKFGATNFIFPVGNGVVERTVEINSLSGASEFNARYLANTPNRYSRLLPLRDVDWLEYWPITKVSGSTARVTMNWDASKVYFPNYILPDVVAAGWNGALWTDNGGIAIGNVATTGTITSNVTATFNLFTFGSKSWVLPLELLSFTATRQDNYTKVEWKTSQETVFLILLLNAVMMVLLFILSRRSMHVTVATMKNIKVMIMPLFMELRITGCALLT